MERKGVLRLADRGMRRRTKFLQYVIAQSVGVALTGLCKFDDLVCEYFIGPDQKPCGQQTRGRLS